MLSREWNLTPADREALCRLEDFLPRRIFDAHFHLFDPVFTPRLQSRTETVFDWERYRQEMGVLFGKGRLLSGNFFLDPDPSHGDPACENARLGDAFLLRQLEAAPENTAEILVAPGESEEQLEGRLVHPRFRGLKCYHLLAGGQNTAQCDVAEYLPESAWQVANRRKLAITLHLVKDGALSDPKNLEYILSHTKRYPDATLILAHCGRAFASWTGVEAVERVAQRENVWFDFSAVCESPAMLRILQKIDRKHLLWGSDYPICRARGKAFSLADGFLWLYQADLERLYPERRIPCYAVAVENLLAVRQACLLADWKEDAVEDLFYHNSRRLFFGA